MKKNIHFFVIFVFASIMSTSLSAQIDTLHQSVIGSAGEVLKSDNYILSFTLGEVIIETFDDQSNIMLAQGFHQPDSIVIDSILLATKGVSSFDGEIKLFPNPTNGYITVELKLLQKENFDMNLYDSSGRKLKFSTHSLMTGTIEIDISYYSDGIYYLEIIDAKNQKRQTLKIIKS